jgi:outer membrane lipoprotein LolB
VTATRLAAGCCLAAVLLATGCATVLAPTRPPADDRRAAWDRHVQAMQEVDQWVVRGRLAVKTEKRGETVSMFWRRDGDNHDINLYGPMGAGRVILTQDARGATLRDSEDKTYRDDSAEALLYRVMGWRVPFQSMQYWVLGMAAPGGDYEVKLDRWGRPTRLTQNGWRIKFQEYHYLDGRDLPRKMVMNALPGTRHIVGGAPGENETIQVKALISRWDWP